ncbi:hypothetical protein Pam1_36 [Pseudanabaena phage Pam1]|nr:hypothetical protein Pam1_36 [Pseudanabaena phage Pam1]
MEIVAVTGYAQIIGYHESPKPPRDKLALLHSALGSIALAVIASHAFSLVVSHFQLGSTVSFLGGAVIGLTIGSHYWSRIYTRF